MIDIRKLKELVRLMVTNDLTELDLRDNEEQVTLRRQQGGGAGGTGGAGGQPQGVSVAPKTNAAASGTVTASADVAMDGFHKIESPMVGTFYTASDPDSSPFVKVGDRVAVDTVVCLIEAMKIFNEIRAECSGTVEKVLVNNAEAVEFGQPLFAVKLD
ncbi:MAG: acetyl-CoA carboxylase biotin carboxyl carrier protein [Planctomycetes bacterium]|nr:acetyl-CoA carboxylase biotin carboxyl carrier protein [Planctomycetota bacterium]